MFLGAPDAMHAVLHGRSRVLAGRSGRLPATSSDAWVTITMSTLGAPRRPPRIAVAAALVAGIATAGCGDRLADRQPPSPPIVVSATISARAVSVSPARVRARTVVLRISNQTSRSRQLVLRSVRLGRGAHRLAQATGPINPGGTISLSATLGEGRYVASVRGSTIAAAALTVGPAARGRQDDLLAP